MTWPLYGLLTRVRARTLELLPIFLTDRGAERADDRAEDELLLTRTVLELLFELFDFVF